MRYSIENRKNTTKLKRIELPYQGHWAWDVMALQIKIFCGIVKAVPKVLPKGASYFMEPPKSMEIMKYSSIQWLLDE